MNSPIESTFVKPVPVKILIVDDDVSNGALVTRLLEAAGYAAEQSLNPLKAIPLLRDGEYSLVILDHTMPGMDGLTLLAEIRKESNVPVVMLTGSDQSALAVRAIRLGAFDYLIKPVDEQRLIDTVRQAIEAGIGPGDRIAQYEIDREVGRGGMGVVYAARDPRLDRTVALKVLLPEFAADPTYEVIFLREARIAAKFSHPNIVTIHESGRFRGRLFMAMEFVQGELLENFVGAGKALPAAKVFDIGAQVASALEAMHAAGMVHRDLKPANLMMTAGSTVKVLDFGLVRPAGPIGTGVKDGKDDKEAVCGTLSYTPPELLSHGQTDARGDIYALGVVLYELLTGLRAFESTSLIDLIHRIGEARLTRPLSEITGVPPEAIDLLRGMMALKPEERFASIGEVRAALQGLRRISGDRRSGRP
jgi:serine/threonine protein kinase